MQTNHPMNDVLHLIHIMPHSLSVTMRYVRTVSQHYQIKTSPSQIVFICIGNIHPSRPKSTQAQHPTSINNPSIWRNPIGRSPSGVRGDIRHDDSAGSRSQRETHVGCLVGFGAGGRGKLGRMEVPVSSVRVILLDGRVRN